MGKYTGKIFVLCRGSIIVFYLLPVWFMVTICSPHQPGVD